MIGHLLGHPLGLVHSSIALVALVLAGAVMVARKGTGKHRWIGRCYTIAMVLMNGTALVNSELYGRFGPFHWMALASLATVLAGYAAVRRKGWGWQRQHAYFMVGSFVALMAAAVAEVASRVPGCSSHPCAQPA